AGGDIQAVERVERRQLALDAHRRITIDLALDIHAGRLRLLVVEHADAAVHLLNGSGEAGRQAEVGEVGRAVLDGYSTDVNRQRFTGFRLGIVRRCRLRHDQFADVGGQVLVDDEACVRLIQLDALDRKSTRLNSSHVKISYAVFCLKKKRSK